MSEEIKYISKVSLKDEIYYLKDQQAQQDLLKLFTETLFIDCGTSTSVIDEISE